MAKDKKLIDLYTEWKQIQSYKDGGKVTDESSDEAIAIKAKKYNWSPEQVQQIKELRGDIPGNSPADSILSKQQNPDPYKNFAEYAQNQPQGYAQGGQVRRSMAQRIASPIQVIDPNSGQVKQNVSKYSSFPANPTPAPEPVVPAEQQNQDLSDIRHTEMLQRFMDQQNMINEQRFADNDDSISDEKHLNDIRNDLQGFYDGGKIPENNPLDSLSQDEYEQLRIAPSQDVGELQATEVPASILESQYVPEEEKALASLPAEKIQEEKQRDIASIDESKILSSKDDLASAESRAEQRKQDIKDSDIPFEQDQKPEEGQSFSRLIASLKPGNQSNELKDAQKQRDLNLALNNIAQGLTMAAYGSKKVDPSRMLKSLEDDKKFANLPVQKYDEIIANQKFDPSSTMSQSYRQAYERITGTKPPETWSANDMKEHLPLIEKYVQAQQTAQAKKETALQNLEYKKERAQELDALRKQGLISQEEFRKGILALGAQKVAQADSRLGVSTEKSIQNDPTIKKANDRINSADSALTQLKDPSQPLTNARLNAIQIDLANTLNFMSSQGASDYKAKSDKLETLNTRLAALRQKYGNKLIDLRKEAPEVYKEVTAYAQSVKDSVQKIKDQQDKHLRKQYGSALGGGAASERIQANQEPSKAEEIERLDPKSGKTAIFDSNTKQFIRWK